jgi:hypothetical protein
MTILDAQPSSVFPDVPRSPKIADKEGNIHRDWCAGLGALFQTLQTQFSNEGYQFPRFTPTQQAAIQSIYQPYVIGTLPLPINVPDISSAMIYDPVNFVPKMFIITFDASSPPNVLTASWKTFTLT